MRTIKKIEVTPVVSDGQIINSLNTTDDKTKNTYSMQVIENYVNTQLLTKQNVVLSGTSDPDSSLGEDGDIYIQYES